MTLEDTRREPRKDSRRSTGVVRPDEDQPLGNIGGRVRDGLGNWLRSPALDFYGLIIVGALLVSVGLVMVLSSSSVGNISRGASGFDGFIRQGTFAVMGVVALVTAALLPPGFYRRAAWVLFAVGLALQCLVHVPGLGVEVYGNRNWIQIGSQRLQPSEFLKLALAVWLGALLATKRPLLTKPFHLFIPLAPGAGVALGLVMWGKDLGTVLVMGMLVAGAVWVAGSRAGGSSPPAGSASSASWC
nr:FtsW/RodA/SpoVE family cell cycle protein [Brachybacterium sp. Z12]